MKSVSGVTLVCLAFLFSVAGMAQPGKYAESEFKKLINTSFTDEKSIAGLEGYQLQEWILLNRVDDPERLFLNVYVKETSRIILFSALTDTAKNIFEILDVVQLKNVNPGLEFKAVTCRRNKSESAEIVALVAPGERKYFTNVKKAWRFNRDKRRIEIISIKGIDCLNEGFEQY